MLALFLALTFALFLLIWGELPARAPASARVAGKGPAQRAKAATPVPPLEEVSAKAGRAAAASVEDDDAIMARLADLLDGADVATADAPNAAAKIDTAPSDADDLPRISGFAPGDAIELEVEGPMPHPSEISFEQIGRDARVLICGVPALLLEGVAAAALDPEILRFRSLRLG